MTQVQAGPADVPGVALEAEPSYLLGFPMLVAVTYDNTGSATQFLRLPELTFWTMRGRFSLSFEPVGQGVRLETKPYFPQMEETGMVLNPGEALRMPLDLSNFATGLKPGTYRVSLTLYVGRHSRASRPVDVKVALPSEADAAIAERLRRMPKVPTDTGGWGPFLTRNWNTVGPVGGLSAVGQRHVRLHLFLHRAIYGPDGPAALDYSPLKTFDGPVQEPEAQLLMLEGQVAAKGAPSARKQADGIIKKWPALQRRVEETMAGKGLIGSARREFGAEAKRVKPPATQPYK